MDNTTQFCPWCGKQTLANAPFCTNCGKEIKQKPQPPSGLKELGIYLLSFFLPPLGLYPAIRYLRRGDDTSKRIGIIAIILTIASIILSIFIISSIFSFYSHLLNTELSPYRSLGY